MLLLLLLLSLTRDLMGDENDATDPAFDRAKRRKIVEGVSRLLETQAPKQAKTEQGGQPNPNPNGILPC